MSSNRHSGGRDHTRDGERLGACPACASPLEHGLAEWHLACTECSYEGSRLEPRILAQADGGDLDEASRASGLNALRNRNFHKILHLIDRLLPAGQPASRPRLLEIGCAHGWFLRAASDTFDVVGIEPDAAVAGFTTHQPLDIRRGFFPGMLADDELFDAIVFNDVLEHIVDVRAALRSCHARLMPAGLLVVNAPDRRGLLYRLSKVAATLGAVGFFARLWQVGFPSPHAHYFDTDSIRSLAEGSGFELLHEERLPSVSLSGLYSRIRYSGDTSPIASALVAAAVATSIPLLAITHSDTTVWLFRKTPQLPDAVDA